MIVQNILLLLLLSNIRTAIFPSRQACLGNETVFSWGILYEYYTKNTSVSKHVVMEEASSALQWFSPSLFYSSSEWAERGGQTCPESNRILGRRNIRKGRGGREAVIEIIDGVDWMEWYDFNFNLEFSSLLTSTYFDLMEHVWWVLLRTIVRVCRP